MRNVPPGNGPTCRSSSRVASASDGFRSPPLMLAAGPAVSPNRLAVTPPFTSTTVTLPVLGVSVRPLPSAVKPTASGDGPAANAASKRVRTSPIVSAPAKSTVAVTGGLTPSAMVMRTAPAGTPAPAVQVGQPRLRCQHGVQVGRNRSRQSVERRLTINVIADQKIAFKVRIDTASIAAVQHLTVAQFGKRLALRQCAAKQISPTKC